MTRRSPLIVVARGDGPPPAVVDGVVVEDDRDLVLGAAPLVREPGESVVALVQAMVEARSCRPGQVVVRGRRPVYIHAVVHDLGREPSWEPKWVAEALAAALAAAEERQVRTLAMPLLGRVHGRLPEGRCVELLAAALERARPRHLARLWLLSPPRRDPAVVFAPLVVRGYRVLQVWDGGHR